MRQHHALGRPGGAGGEHHGDGRLGIVRGDLVGRARVALGGGQERLDCRIRDLGRAEDPRHARHLRARRRHRRPLLGIAQEQRLHPAARRRVGDIAAAVAVVQRHGDDAEPGRRQIQNDPVGAGARHDADAVAALEAQLPQQRLRLAGAAEDVAPAVLEPLAERAAVLEVGDRVRGGRGARREHFPQGAVGGKFCGIHDLVLKSETACRR